MLTAKDLKALLEDVPGDTEVVCTGLYGWPTPVKHADLTRRGDRNEVVLCPMGTHLKADTVRLRTVTSLPAKENA